MIPMLLGITAASSILGKIFAPHQARAPQASNPIEFQKQLDVQLQNKVASPDAQIQKFIAQQNTGTLSVDQQFALGKLLLGKNVQLTDASGNSVVGQVSDVHLQNGQAQLMMRGKSYPISSVKAVLDGISLH